MARCAGSNHLSLLNATTGPESPGKSMRRSTTGPAPGAVRRWWWGASQRTRLAIASLGTVAGMAACVLVLSPFQTEPYLNAFGLTDDTTPSRPSGAPAVPRDEVVTIVSLSAVDALDGTDRANHPVLLRVPGIHSAPPCWAGPALDSASQLILGKKVTLSDLGDVEAGRAAARIRLPDGRDYAQAVVSAGVATAVDGDLATQQDEARQAGRGLWGAKCEPAGIGTPPPPVPTSKPLPTPSSPAPPPTSAGPPTAPPPGGIQLNVRRGARCAPEGALGFTSRGQALVCTKAGDGTTRWGKA